MEKNKRLRVCIFGIEVVFFSYSSGESTSTDEDVQKRPLLEKSGTESPRSQPQRHKLGTLIMFVLFVMIIIKYPELAVLIQHLLS